MKATVGVPSAGADAESRTPSLLRVAISLATAAGLLFAFSYSQFSSRLDHDLAAFRMDTSTRTPSQTLTVVEIDSKSLAAAGEWPWSRERYAQVLDNLNSAGAGLIGFDIDFSSRSTPEGDAALKRAIDQNAGWVVLPTFLQPDYKHLNLPIEDVAENALLASVNIELSSDGRARSYRQGYDLGGNYYPTLAGMLSGAEPGDTRRFYIDYGIDMEQMTTISFDDVLHNRFNPELVRDRSILIGATAIELGDYISTPHAAGVPGVYIHALAYETLFQGRTLRPLPVIWSVLAALVILLAGIWLAAFLRLPQFFILQVGSAAVVLLISMALHEAMSLTMAVSPVLFAAVLNLGYAVRQKVVRDENALSKQKNAHLRFIARHDPETGLPNRVAMIDAVNSAGRAGDQGVTIVIAAGIDRFADIRGAIGYTHANEIVRLATSGLSRAGLGGDFYRLDGSVVATFSRLSSAQEAEEIIEHLASLGSLSSKAGGQSIDLRFLIGVAVSGPDDVAAETLLERAVLSVDHARQQRQDVVRWGAVDFEDPHLKLAMLNDIVSGIDREEFSLVYQPKYSIRTNTIYSAESLLRWEHQKLGAIPPSRFISVAEETGAINALTLWVTERAINDQASLRAEGIDITIAINLSARSLCDVSLCRDIVSRIVLAGGAVMVEITETAMIERPESAAQSLEAFHEAGIKIAIDDYGTGHSSLAYLRSLNAHELKIDRSWMSDVTSSQTDRLILKSTFDLAHALGMQVVCEGVEDEMTFSAVAGLGCDLIQGYFTGRPMTLAELSETMRQTGPIELKPVGQEVARAPG